MSQRNAVIAVRAREDVLADRLWSTLTAIYGVRFVNHRDAQKGSVCGVVLSGCDPAEARKIAPRDISCVAFVSGELTSQHSAGPPVQFSTRACPIPAFSGSSVTEKSLGPASGLEAAEEDQAVAFLGDKPIWLRSARAGGTLDLVAACLPLLGRSESLHSQFNDGRWFRLLPLLHLVQKVSGWEFGQLRACVMLDDPNLHWPSYGYAGFDEIARDAQRHNYHCSFATVPMDGWYVNRRAAAIFAANTARLSLMVHGNEHTHYELCQDTSDEEALSVAAHALRRTERMERRSGLRIDRVMAAPHGACNGRMARALARVGFAAACISRGSLVLRNPNTPFPSSVGLTPAEFLGDGFPILPRFHIRDDPNVRVRLAFALGQPAIAVGHHEDLAEGLGLFRAMANTCNSVAEVCWANVGNISRTNYWMKRVGDALVVRMFSRAVSVNVPDGVTSVSIERPWLDEYAGEGIVVRPGGNAPAVDLLSYCGEPVPIDRGAPCNVVQIETRDARARVSPGTLGTRRTRPWPITRRLLCEARDRLRPTLDRVAGRSS
jgi:hypothetical protein